MTTIPNKLTSPKDLLWANAVEFARRQAQTLLKQSGLNSPPIPIECLAPFRSVKRITREEMGNLSGLLLPFEDGYEVKINSNHPHTRQNFSLAHEIGHTFFLKEGGQKLVERLTTELGRKASAKLEEELCDTVAAELLMPSLLFAKTASGYNHSIGYLEVLSRTFDTSIETTAIRLCDLNPRHCFLVNWESGAQNARLRARWSTSRRKLSLKGRLTYNPKVLGLEQIVNEAWSSDQLVFSTGQVSIGNFGAHCQIWSQGFHSGTERFVISFVFPEFPSAHAQDYHGD